MRQALTLFVAVGLLACAVGCGGSVNSNKGGTTTTISPPGMQPGMNVPSNTGGGK